MKRIFKYLVGTIGVVLLLLILFVCLLYFPPVQNYARTKAVEYVSSRYGWEAKIGYFRLVFPLTIEAGDVYAGATATDTTVSVGKLRLEIGLRKIWKQQLSLDDLSLKQVTFVLPADSGATRLRVRVEDVELRADRVDLAARELEADYIRLANGDVVLVVGQDTTRNDSVSQPFNWTFAARHVEIQNTAFRMSSPVKNGEAGMAIDAGMAAGRITTVRVDLGIQTVDADSVAVQGAWCYLHTPPSVATGSDPSAITDSLLPLPWKVRAATLRMENSAFSLLSPGNTMNLLLSGIAVEVDSVYNCGTVVKADLRNLQLVQKDGIRLKAMQAVADLDTAATSVGNAYIQTAHSNIRLNVYSAAPVQHLLEDVPLDVTLEGVIGLSDVVPFYPALPAGLKDKKVQVSLSAGLSKNDLRLDYLRASMAGNFDVSGRGKVTSYNNIRKAEGKMELSGQLPDIRFLRHLLKNERITVPAGMTFSANLKANRGDMSALLRLCQEHGCLTLDAGYNMNTEAYAGEVVLNQFQPAHFFPVDSLGGLSGRLSLSGRYFTWAKARADVRAEIHSLEYKGHDYRDISLDIDLKRTHLESALTVRDAAAPVSLIIRGDSLGRDYAASVIGYVGDVDLEALHLVPYRLSVGGNLDVRATVGPDQAYTLRVALDSLRITDVQQQYHPGGFTFNLGTDMQGTKLAIQSGDFTLGFRSDTSLMAVVKSFQEVSHHIQEQIADRNVDMEALRPYLPVCALDLKSGQNNVFARYLKSQQVGFRDIDLNLVVRERTGFRMSLLANAPYYNTVRLDSMQIGVWQSNKSLVYALNVSSPPKDWQDLLNVNLLGRLQGDQSRVELKQKDRAGNIGFDLGFNLTLRDSAFAVSLFPITPILGYRRWVINPDNKVTLVNGKRIEANLRLTDQDKFISILSLAPTETERDRLQLQIQGFDLAMLSRSLPFLPPLAGILNTDLLLYSRDNAYGADGDIQVNDLYYQQQRVGTLGLGLKYVVGGNLSEHSVDFELRLDSIHRAVMNGTFSTADTNKALKVDLNISSLPLHLANAFLPDGLLRLGGELAGDLKLRGTLTDPRINGGLAFRRGKADVLILGTAFGIDSTRIPVRDGRILFKGFRFMAPNQSLLSIDGNVALTPFDKMQADLALAGSNFEVVNVKQNPSSIIYGKAYANINAAIKGRFSDLALSGNVGLLNRTNITYTLRSSAPGLEDRSADLVRFVAFRDTTLSEEDRLTNQVSTSSFVMRMLIEIGDNVALNVNLSEDGSNNVAIKGGGNLVFSINPENGMGLSGKYILTGGTVTYNVPIAGKKVFNIQTGSYVEWTGNVADPILQISAAESVKATVVDGDQNRLVTFESIIRIQNALSSPDITFDLSAPSDMVIQNQLATFSPEERTRQALNLLIYSTYTAPGAATSGAGGNIANNALYGFVENELNKYTRQTGVTFGFDSYNTDEATTRTDFTYEFSKQLFNDRVRVKIGGRISTDNNENQKQDIQNNLVDDIAIEYLFTKKHNLFLKVFRHSNYESVLEGEVTQTGIGVVWRKNYNRLIDLFIPKPKREMRNKQRLEKMMEREKEKTLSKMPKAEDNIKQ